MSLQKVNFSGINREIPIRVFNRDGKIFSSFYSLNEIYDFLLPIRHVEIGGEYDIRRGFVIDPKASFFDQKENRPYTILNMESNSKIVWHSHPFNHSDTCYPSLEDLEMSRQYNNLVFILLSKKGIYVMSVNKYVHKNRIIEFYQRMQTSYDQIGMDDFDYDEIRESFLNNKNNDVSFLFYRFISWKQNFIQEALNNTIETAFEKKTNYNI